MDGIGLPILAFLFGTILFLIATARPRFRRFALAAIVAPTLTSFVFLLGSWILSDMDPCVEYGSSCIPDGGRASDGFDVSLWLMATAVTFVVSAVVCYKIQSIWSRVAYRKESGYPERSV